MTTTRTIAVGDAVPDATLTESTAFGEAFPIAPTKISVAEAVRGKRNLPLGLTLQDRLIVVVEDEVAVREGLVVVLQAWGAAVLAFDTVSALEAWLAGAPAERPDLALVDFRLPDSRTGIDALVALRRQWPTPRLPAIMITGSSLGGHEDQAQTHDYHLLIKPVLPNKLRAMIAFKLDMR